MLSPVNHDPVSFGRRDRVHVAHERVDLVYGIIVCVLWEFCEFFGD
jgi:hypothetical protein